MRRTVALIAAQLALVAALLWFGLPQSLGGRADWVMVSGTSMLPRLHTGDLVLVERQSSYHVGEVVAYRVPKGQVGAGHVVIHRIIGGNGTTGLDDAGRQPHGAGSLVPDDHDVIGASSCGSRMPWFVLRLFHMPAPARALRRLRRLLRIAFADDGETDDDAPAAVEEHG